ncbi:hypothetical protein RR48_14756 [Papilio machaon]|uniref:Uncharacterized protein n=1 Tax=Papilio machaon TaxID=76193 RepID=A0A194R083_PAPMA|nr:hypothetical protein RR48_14756 [Papilio machaon]
MQGLQAAKEKASGLFANKPLLFNVYTSLSQGICRGPSPFLPQRAISGKLKALKDISRVPSRLHCSLALCPAPNVLM